MMISKNWPKKKNASYPYSNLILDTDILGKLCIRKEEKFPEVRAFISFASWEEQQKTIAKDFPEEEENKRSFSRAPLH